MSLLSSSRKATVLSPPLPVVNRQFAQHGLVFRRGQFSLVAAAPGVGKSVLATNLVVRTQVPAFYASADSDEWTVKQRACSILTGQQLSLVEQQLNEEAWEEFYADKLRSADHVDWSFQTDIDPEYIGLRLNAYAEARGDFPSLIIIDNLGNTVVDQDNEAAELRAACRDLQSLARRTKAHVMALHHVKGPKENGDKPILLGDLLYNLGKIPEVVLGLHRDPQGVMLTVPKYRGGKHGMTIPLNLDYSTATVGGFQ